MTWLRTQLPMGDYRAEPGWKLTELKRAHSEDRTQQARREEILSNMKCKDQFFGCMYEVMLQQEHSAAAVVKTFKTFKPFISIFNCL